MSEVIEIERFLGGVERRALRMASVAIGNSDDALDIVQDVMLAFVDKYARRAPDEWAPLFFRMLRNKTTDYHRKRAVRQRLFAWVGREDAADVIDEQSAPQTAWNPDAQQAGGEFLGALVAALRTLPHRQRDTFMLRAWQGMDVRETALVMKCSQGTVKTQYSRALKSLRETLKEFVDD